MGSLKAGTARLARGIEAVLRWRAFPRGLQWSLAVVAGLVVFLALRPLRHAEVNPGAAILWQLWWPLLPFLILLTARLWCAVCPIPALGEMVWLSHRRSLPLPPPQLRRIGPWLAAALLTALSFAFLLSSLEINGRLTALLLIGFALGAGATALFWRGRSFCRYLCPLGLMIGLYSRLAWLRLGPADNPGRKAAAASARRCPLFTSPVASRRAQDCVLCATCLQEKEGEAVAVRLEAPTLTRPALLSAEAVAVTLLLGALLADALRMTPLYLRYMAWALPLLGWNYRLTMGLGMAGVMGALLAGQTAAALLWGRRSSFWPFFGRLSLAWLPLALAAHLALSAQHLLAAGTVYQNLAAELALVSPGHLPPTDAYSFLWPLKGLQWVLLLAGAMIALAVARRWPGSQSKAYLAAAVVPALALLVIFLEPMSVAC